MGKKVLSFIGALVGGFLFSIPWILVYIFGNMMFSALAIPIAFGALFGYKLFSKPTKKTSILISIVSIIVIVVVTLVIIPLCLMAKEGISVSLENLEYVYGISKFQSAIMRDLFISVIFTILGISGVISQLKSETDPEYAEKAITPQNLKEKNLEEISRAKQAFQKFHAMDKYSAVEKSSILNELDEKTFKKLKLQQIIKKHNGKFYFSEKAEKNLGYRFITLYLKMLGIIFLVIILVIILFALFK